MELSDQEHDQSFQLYDEVHHAIDAAVAEYAVVKSLLADLDEIEGKKDRSSIKKGLRLIMYLCRFDHSRSTLELLKTLREQSHAATPELRNDLYPLYGEYWAIWEKIKKILIPLPKQLKEELGIMSLDLKEYDSASEEEKIKIEYHLHAIIGLSRNHLLELEKWIVSMEAVLKDLLQNTTIRASPALTGVHPKNFVCHSFQMSTKLFHRQEPRGMGGFSGEGSSWVKKNFGKNYEEALGTVFLSLEKQGSDGVLTSAGYAHSDGVGRINPHYFQVVAPFSELEAALGEIRRNPLLLNTFVGAVFGWGNKSKCPMGSSFSDNSYTQPLLFSAMSKLMIKFPSG
ncbi:hypothetical protein HY496_02850 [Candidatus Woesearchaeota archaeon]|nr:hypothetical protein [Candidatus Woesearchaeota archaeon]